MSVSQAAALLGLDPDLMVAWNMVVVVGSPDETARVPRWCVDPRIVGILPILSDLFQGEALETCLHMIDPYGDGRDGVEALLDGDWRGVCAKLTDLRDRLDSFRDSADRSIAAANPFFV